jgi:glycerophosphoryl diester phosphodiesterase
MNLFRLIGKCKVIFILGSVLIAFLVITEVLYVGHEFRKVEGSNNKVWRHRGGNPENTVEGITKSITEDQFDGVEIDLFYNNEKNIFYVTHDKPMVDKQYQSFESYLIKLRGMKVSYWLDLKNLTTSNREMVATRLSLLKNKYNSFQNYIIESKNYRPLRELASMGENTIYWINPHAKSRIRIFRDIINKWKIILSDFVGVSVYYTQFQSSLKKSSLLKKIPVYLFTINDESILKKLIGRSNVKVILSRDIGPI